MNGDGVAEMAIHGDHGRVSVLAVPDQFRQRRRAAFAAFTAAAANRQAAAGLQQRHEQVAIA